MESAYDVVVVGGGAAGLGAALTLGRALRSVLVVDVGHPRNAPAGHVHNYLGREGSAPGELLATGRDEVAGYGGEVVPGTVTAATPLDGDDVGFRVELADGSSVTARRLLVTTGLVDELPDVHGLAERWGRDVLHCPYCHGYEVRGQALGVLATSPMAVHQSLLFRQWSSDVTLFLHTAPAPTPDEAEQLAARGITVVDGEVAALEAAEDKLTGVWLVDGRVFPRQAVVVQPRFTARTNLLTSLGLELTEMTVGDYVAGTFVAADTMGATVVPGVWVAGNVADLRAQVIGAAAAGLNAAAAINADLIAEDTRHAVAAHRNGKHGGGTPAHGEGAPVLGREFWDERYRSHASVWSGDPNAHLVTDAADLTPGTALDVGAGEGADAVWLAERGWTVTAVDISAVALERGAAQAAKAGPGVAARIEWVPADLTTWVPPPATYDLVSAQFMHLPAAQRGPLFAALAESVAPGGTLLIVGHHLSDLQTTMPRWAIPEMFFTAEDIAQTLDPLEWDLVSETRPRTATDPAGQTVTIHDAVLRARRSPVAPSAPSGASRQLQPVAVPSQRGDDR